MLVDILIVYLVGVVIAFILYTSLVHEVREELTLADLLNSLYSWGLVIIVLFLFIDEKSKEFIKYAENIVIWKWKDK